MTASANDGKADGKSSPAPAVSRAIQILEYLAVVKPQAGVSEIASALHINKSTCFNILRTLADESIVIKDSRYPVYRLGPRLIELGTASRRNFSHRGQIAEVVRPLVESLGLTCLIAQALPADRGAIVVDRIVPRGKAALTAPIGHVYPLTVPAIGRVILAARDIEDVLAFSHGLDATEEETSALLAALDVVRARGFSSSAEEYQEDVNAVAAPVYGPTREIAFVLALIGHPDEFPASKIAEFGPALCGVAEQLGDSFARDGSSFGFTG
jgi:DNA-binding IclR family transcriptional regulator